MATRRFLGIEMRHLEPGCAHTCVGVHARASVGASVQWCVQGCAQCCAQCCVTLPEMVHVMGCAPGGQTARHECMTDVARAVTGALSR